MSERRDEEFWTLKVVEIIKTYLNARITAINAEKNDGITLALVDSNAYYYDDFGPNDPVFDPVVLFGVNPEEGETRAGESQEQLSITIEMIASHKLIASSETRIKTVARYRRAIKEALKQGVNVLPSYSLKGLPDLDFKANAGVMHLVFGIGVRFKFVN